MKLLFNSQALVPAATLWARHHTRFQSLFVSSLILAATAIGIRSNASAQTTGSAITPVSLSVGVPAVKADLSRRIPALLISPQASKRLTGDVNVVVQLANGQSTAALKNSVASQNFTANARKSNFLKLNSEQTAVSKKLKTLGARELGRLKHSLNAVIVTVNASKISEIRKLADVKSAKVIGDYKMDLSEVVPYVGAKTVQTLGVTGKGVKVAVLDSGIDYTHRNLGGPGTIAAYETAHANPAVIAPGTFPTTKVIGGYDFVGEIWPNGSLAEDPNPIDYYSHGTHVADIIAGKSLDGLHKGVAPGASLYAVKVCSAVSSSCSGVALLEGVEYALDPDGDPATADQVDVINLSLGSNYGQVEDDLSAALANAVSLGVVVVASAGNAGDREYVVGSPSSTTELISVAQTSVPGAKAYPLIIQPGSSASGTYANTNTVDWAPVVGTVTAPLIYGGIGAGAALPSGTTEADFAGKIVLVDRGTYSISVKVDYFADLGAVGIVLANNVAGDPPSFSYGGGYDDEFNAIPTLVVTDTLGYGASSPLRAALVAGPVTATISDANSISLSGSIVSTSSRGPTISYNEIKPDIGAPGAAVSAEVGTGDGETAFGGTSGAAPVVSGAAALLLQVYPKSTPLEIKSRLMNSAYRGVVTNPITDPGVLAPVTRIGAGEVRVNKAALLTTTAVVLGDRPAPSLSFGFYRTLAKTEITKTVEVKNYSTRKRTYKIASDFLYADDRASGAVIIKPSTTSLSVSAGGKAKFTVKATIDPTKLPVWAINGGSLGGSGNLLQSVEFDGYVTITDSSDTVALPFQVLPHKAAGNLAISTSLNATSGSASTVVTNLTGATAGYTGVFSLVGTSPRVPSSELPGPGDNFAVIDLHDVGVRVVDFGTTTPVYGLEFAIAAYAPRAHPNYPAEYDIYIDTNGDGASDFVVWNQELNGFGSSGINAVYTADLATGSSTAKFYTNADLNSTNVSFYVLLSDLGGIAPTTPLSFSVYAFDNYFTGNLTDAIEDISYTPAYPKFLPSAWDLELATGQTQLLGVTYNATNASVSPSQTGLLLFHADAKADAEEQAITVKAP